MTVLVTGAAGQLGRAVVDEVRERGSTAVGCDKDTVPIEDPAAVRAFVLEVRPAIVVHCAAWTDVDGCERDPEEALAVNGEGVAHVAAACREVGAVMVHVSTDYVFAGDADRPYREDDPVGPRSVYGASKLAGERAIAAAGLERAFVARTSWVFGPGGNNFPRAILARARTGQPLRVVGDQVGCPTFTRDLASALLDLAASGAPPGTYHAANDGHCSWHAFAVELCRRAGVDVPIEEITTAELGRPAPRPAWSVLDCARLASVRGRRLPSWQDALDRFLAEERT